MPTLRFKAIVGTCALAPVLLLTAPAHAAQHASTVMAVVQLSDGVCPTGYFCIFRDVGFGGGGYGVRQDHDLNDFRGIELNDQMSSYVNATNDRYCWYPDINFSGDVRVIGANQAGDVDLRTDNDIASSLANC